MPTVKMAAIVRNKSTAIKNSNGSPRIYKNIPLTYLPMVIREYAINETFKTPGRKEGNETLWEGEDMGIGSWIILFFVIFIAIGGFNKMKK
ncbi:hypothetical protein [Halobacillus trueperi]|uniref:hypothetical protein n=1 Tax=Halobacillus trueperi TaxID=156205 RepID=UPI0037351895